MKLTKSDKRILLDTGYLEDDLDQIERATIKTKYTLDDGKTEIKIRTRYINMYRTIKITSGMTNDFLIIETNATNRQIEAMCYKINENSENGKGFIAEDYTKSLNNGISFNTIYDSEFWKPDDDEMLEETIIDKYFDLFDYYND